MKKTILLFSLFFLTACGSPVVQDNKNNTLSELPSFVDLNSNSAYPSLNLNSYGITGVENINGNEGTNTNINSMNLSVSLNTNTNTNEVPVRSVNINLLSPHEGAFDCQPLSVYEQMDFYPLFLKQFEALYRYSATDIKNMIPAASSENMKQEIVQKASQHEMQDHITSSCLSKDASLFLVVSEGDKGGYGFKIIRYQPGRSFLETAQREDAQYGSTWAYTPLSFGRRTGTTLSMSVTGKTGDLSESISFFYDYVNHYIRVNEYCSTKTGGKKACGNYPYIK